MGATTNIEWCDHTWNPWRGCTKVSPGCAHCYAEAGSKRNPQVLGEWGPNGRRAIAAESYWRQPLTWDRAAAKAGVRRRVFCASLADVFEAREDLVEPRERLFRLISETPNLDWLLLTKRPDVAVEHWPLWCGFYAGTIMKDQAQKDGQGLAIEIYNTKVLPNVWLGVSIENQETADERIPLLLQVPAKVRFLSVEPLLGPVDLRHIHHDNTVEIDALTGDHGVYRPLAGQSADRIHWVIVGGESGPHARPCNVAWIRSIVQQFQQAAVPCFVKQLGRFVVADELRDNIQDWPTGTKASGNIDNWRIDLADPKGGDPDEWPEDLRVREFPETCR